jgi:hypothetical protein
MREGDSLRSVEWVRYASVAGVRVAGGMDKLLSHFVQAQSPDHIMTYADRDWGYGDVYLRLGFTKEAIMPPTRFLVSVTGKHRYYPGRLPVIPGIDPARLIHDDAALAAGFLPVYNAGTNKFAKLVNGR